MMMMIVTFNERGTQGDGRGQTTHERILGEATPALDSALGLHPCLLLNCLRPLRLLVIQLLPHPRHLPLQLVVGDRTGGVSGGRWRWQGTRLFYENGEQTNQGLFYSCADVNGLNGLFLFLQA